MTKSEQMARVRARDTEPERVVRRLLSAEGVRYRLHRSDLPGKPDVYVPRLHLAVFVNGCFWHGHDCERSTTPKTNSDFWKRKIDGNRIRDERVRRDLTELGIEEVTLWTCERDAFEKTCKSIARRYRKAAS